MSAARRSPETRFFLPVLGSLLAIAFLFIGVFPTRALLAQRSDIASAEATLEHLEARNAELGGRVDALGTDAEIERIAREQYHLVYPGEEAYALLPAPPPTIPVPEAMAVPRPAAAMAPPRSPPRRLPPSWHGRQRAPTAVPAFWATGSRGSRTPGS